MTSTAAVAMHVSPIAGETSEERLVSGRVVASLAHAVIDEGEVTLVTIERRGAGENLGAVRTGESRAKGRVGTDITASRSSNVAVDVGIAADLGICLLAAGFEIGRGLVLGTGWPRV